METNPQLADTSIQTNQKHSHHHHHHHHHNPHNQYPQHHHYLRQQHNRKQQQQQQQQLLQRNPSLHSETNTTSSTATSITSSTSTAIGITTRSQRQQTKDYLGGAGEPSGSLASGADVRTQSSSNIMAYQHKHALHRLRRLKKRAPHRDLVISFVPRLRTSIINRLDFFNRYSKQEQEVLSCFDFLDELVLNYCDGGTESPRYSQKLYQSMINELIDSV